LEAGGLRHIWRVAAPNEHPLPAWRHAPSPRSKARQHFSRPHIPADLSGVSGNFWSFTCRTDTDGRTQRKLLQQSGRPQGPHVPARFARSRGPSRRRVTRMRSSRPSARHNSRKSIFSPDVKNTVTARHPGSTSTATNRSGRLLAANCLRQIIRTSARRTSSCARELRVVPWKHPRLSGASPLRPSERSVPCPPPDEWASSRICIPRQAMCSVSDVRCRVSLPGLFRVLHPCGGTYHVPVLYLARMAACRAFAASSSREKSSSGRQGIPGAGP
jgi:hypothetical protein